MPYVSPTDDFLAGMSSFSLVIIFLCCFTFKYIALVELPGIEAILSSSQRSTFSPDPIAVIRLFLLALFATLVASLGIFVLNLSRAVRRGQREARDRRARRLRHIHNQEAVLAPALPPPFNFHLFLSHTWAQGEEAMRTVKLRLLELVPELKVFLDKDDLVVGDGCDMVDQCAVVLCFCTAKYFESRACALEMFRAVLLGRPLIALLEPDASRGGLRQADIEARLVTARYAPRSHPNAPADLTWTSHWGLDGVVKMWEGALDRTDLQPPSGEAVVAALFAVPAIEWNLLSTRHRCPNQGPWRARLSYAC